MTRKILFVDDEENVLSAYTRVLRKRFQLETSLGGEEALDRIQREGPFAVIVSDMRMPGMDGVQLLAKIKELAPDTIRVMLTGNADQQTAMDAVNQGAIFRFLTKPCDPETLASVLMAALEQYRLVTAEKILLEQTLKGAIAMLVELLSMLDSTSFGRSQRLSELSEKVAREMGMPSPWMMAVASVLCQIGVLTVPHPVVEKARVGGLLNSAEREIFHRIPEIGSNLIGNIPRLEEVAFMVYYAQKNFNGTGFPVDDVREGAIPLGSRILRAVNDYLDLLPKKTTPRAAVLDMHARTAWYDLAVLQALKRVLEEEDAAAIHAPEPQRLLLADLKAGFKTMDGIETRNGWLVIPTGIILRESHLEKLRNFALLTGLKEPMLVQPC
jgi:response regulator RpfG family c-di-GMP phosphodiesterase